MRTKISTVLAVVVGLAIPAPASADHTTQPVPCVLDVDEASASNPHMVDPSGDWEGLSGNGTEDGLGELYREGVDLTAIWVARDAEGGLDARMQIANLGEPQPNTIFYFIWYYPDTVDDGVNRSTRWASARLRGYTEPIFTYGYLGQGVTSSQFFTDGTTTGSVTPGPSGEISIDLPLEQMGIVDTSGEYFHFFDFDSILGGSGILGGESRILVGSPEPLPPPSPLRHGFVYEADTMANADPVCSAAL